MELSWEQVTARRVARHGLVGGFADVVAAARGILGGHAQVMAAGELSLCLRTPGSTRADVRAALWDTHALVKSFGPRGTVHLLPAAELATWNAAMHDAFLGYRPSATVAFSDEEAEAVIAAVGDALVDAELTGEELDEAVVARTGPWAREPGMPAFTGELPRWRQLVQRAAYAGALCYGPDRGRAVTFTSPRRLVPGYAPADSAAALRELALRFARAYGPATPEVFARWLHVAPARATAVFTELGDALRPVTADGWEAWLPADDDAAEDDDRGGVRLLPLYDAYGIGCHPRERVFPGPATERALVRGQAGPIALLLLDGVVAGTWRHKRAGKRITVTTEPFTTLTAAQRRQLGTQAERVGEILESASASVTEGDAAPRSG
jgi:hypothetical protein